MSAEYENMQVEKWVNLEDVAEHLSLSQDTVRTWIKEENYLYIKLENDINSKSLKLTNGSEKEKLKNRNRR